MKLEQALADVLVGEWSKTTSLHFPEEVIESLKATLAGLIIIESGLLSRRCCVIHIAVRRMGGLMCVLWLIILVRALRMTAIISTVWIDRVIISGWAWEVGLAADYMYKRFGGNI